jgi:hypothetical protein
VHQHDSADQFAFVVAQRRRRELDGALFARGLAEQHRAARKIVRTAVATDRLAHRVGEQLAVILIHEADDFLEQAAHGLRAAHAQQLLRGRIQIGETAFQVRGHDGFAQRLHRRHLQGRRWGRRRQRRRDHRGARRGFLLVDPAAGEGAQFLRGNHLDAGDQQGRLPLELDWRGS